MRERRFSTQDEYRAMRAMILGPRLADKPGSHPGCTAGDGALARLGDSRRKPAGFAGMTTYDG